MKTLWKVIIVIVVLALLIIGGKTLYPYLQGSEDTLPQDMPQPQTHRTAATDFTVYDAEANAVMLSENKGKPVVVNFWASWCTPCKQEMPDFEEMYKKYGQQVVFMMVNLTDGAQETVETASSFIAQRGFTFPVYFDTQLSAVSAYGMNAVPATFFIDAQGNIATYHLGLITGQQLEENIGILLG